jgi:hypothetical protein
MASGHANRTQRPNTWLHRPSLLREESPYVEIVSTEDLERALEEAAAHAAGPTTGLFGPRSVTWQVCRETAVFLGAGRALLLQLAHPWGRCCNRGALGREESCRSYRAIPSHLRDRAYHGLREPRSMPGRGTSPASAPCGDHRHFALRCGHIRRGPHSIARMKQARFAGAFSLLPRFRRLRSAEIESARLLHAFSVLPKPFEPVWR